MHLRKGTAQKMTWPRVSKPLLPALPVIWRNWRELRKMWSPAKATVRQGMLMPYANVPAPHTDLWTHM